MKDIVREILMQVFKLSANGVQASDIKMNDSVLAFVFTTRYGGSTLWGYFALVGIAFSLIYFILELNRKLMFEGSDFTAKSLIAPFCKLIGSYYVLSRSGFIITRLAGIGNSFVDWAQGYFEATTYTALSDAQIGTLLDQMCDGIGFFKALALLLPCFVMLLVSLVCSLVWKYKAISYKIEVLYRIGISPIALADVYSGNNSQGVRWCKAMLATTLYGASFILCIALGHMIAFQEIVDTMSASDFLDSASSVWEMISKVAVIVVVPIAEIGAISAIRSALKEALA